MFTRLRLGLCLALLAVPFLGACGDSSNAFPFRSAAADPVGAPLRILYELQPGDGVRMAMHMTGTMVMSGDMDLSIPLDQRIDMTVRCTEVAHDGGARLEMAIESAQLSAGSATPSDEGIPGLQGLKGTYTLGADGRVRDIEFEGADPELASQIRKMITTPGFQQFVPMPEGGLRVGEAIDLAKILPAGALEAVLSNAVPGSSVQPEVQGELVLRGTQRIDGEEVVEFDVNMVMNVAGSLATHGQTAEIDMGVRITGKQFNAVRTGLPMGTASWDMTLRMGMETNGRDVDMAMDATMSIACTPLR